MKALICGISGQDGAYLAQLLLEKGYEVVGSSRDASSGAFRNLKELGIDKNVKFVSMSLTDFRNILDVLNGEKPTEVYNLAGQTSVGLSFEQPVEAMESIGNGTLNLLEAIRLSDPEIRFYNAGSSDCFGDTGLEPADENKCLNPCSPYGVAKSSAHFLVKNYRKAYGLFACTGILFNHESPLRPHRFVTQKIVSAAARIAKGSDERVKLGNLTIRRDWGWAPNYVDAMHRMLQYKEATDFVIATGKAIALEEFVEQSFAYFNLEWKRYVDIDSSLYRPSDIKMSVGDATKAVKLLGWTPSTDVYGVIKNMCDYAENVGS